MSSFFSCIPATYPCPCTDWFCLFAVPISQIRSDSNKQHKLKINLLQTKVVHVKIDPIDPVFIRPAFHPEHMVTGTSIAFLEMTVDWAYQVIIITIIVYKSVGVVF